MTAIPAEYDPWIDAATDHLWDSLETARDELERDRDFLAEDAPPIDSPPSGAARDAAIASAVRSLLRRLTNEQEG